MFLSWAIFFNYNNLLIYIKRHQILNSILLRPRINYLISWNKCYSVSPFPYHFSRGLRYSLAVFIDGVTKMKELLNFASDFFLSPEVLPLFVKKRTRFQPTKECSMACFMTRIDSRRFTEIFPIFSAIRLHISNN